MISKKCLFIICIFFFGIKSYGQPELDNYDSSLKKYLLPEIKGKETIEIISFIEKPSFEPESAIRIIGNANHYVIEGRFLKGNHWHEIFSRFKNKEEVPVPEIIFYSLPVSDEFVRKIKYGFSDAMKSKDPQPREDLDGTSYILRLNEAGSIISKKISNPRKEDGPYNLIMSCSQMAKEIKSQSFDEEEFIDISNRNL